MNTAEKIDMLDVLGIEGQALIIPMVDFLNDVSVVNSNGYILLEETRKLWEGLEISVRFKSPDSGKYLRAEDILGNRKPSSQTFKRLFSLYVVEISR